MNNGPEQEPSESPEKDIPADSGRQEFAELGASRVEALGAELNVKRAAQAELDKSERALAEQQVSELLVEAAHKLIPNG